LIRSLKRPLLHIGRGAGGEEEGEGRALARVALGAEAAFVGFDDLAADGEAQASAAEAGLVGAGLGVKKGSKIRRRSAGAMPTPVSAMLTSPNRPVGSRPIRTRACAFGHRLAALMISSARPAGSARG